MPDITLREPDSCDYLYIDDSNQVHLMLPIVGGDEIGLDNTCKTAVELKTFFYGAPLRLSAEQILKNYSACLDADIGALNAQKGVMPMIAYQDELHKKEQRKQQIAYYLDLIKQLKERFDENGEIDKLGRDAYPKFPHGVSRVLSYANNGFAICLSPKKFDLMIRFSSPLFSLKRNTSFNFQGLQISTEFGHYLRSAFKPRVNDVIKIKTRKVKLIDTVVAQVNQTIPHFNASVAQDFDALKAIIQTQLRQMDANISLAIDRYGAGINYNNVVNIYSFDDSYTLNEWVDGILGLAVSDDFWAQQVTSVFYADIGAIDTDDEADSLSIKVQFFLGEINVYCKSQKLSDKKFGAVFDTEPHGSSIAEIVKDGLVRGDDIEALIFAYLNHNASIFALAEPLSVKQQQAIRKKFNDHYTTIKDSPHFDEFFILDHETPGSIFSHQGRISCHFLDFFSFHSSDTQNYFFRQRGGNFNYHDYSQELQRGPSARLNHKNNSVAKDAEQIPFRKKMFEYMSVKPDALLDYLIANTPSGAPNYSLLVPEMQHFIAWHYDGWTAFNALLSQPGRVTDAQKTDLLNLLGRDHANNDSYAAHAWKKHEAKPLLDIELSNVAEGLQQTAKNYQSKRSGLWWKGRQNAARAAQCAALTAVAQDINALLATKYYTRDKILEQVLKSIEVLNRIDADISAEYNLYQSHLQLEIQSFRQALYKLCDIQNVDFQTFAIGDLLAEQKANQLAKINDDRIRGMVSALPAHYHTDEAIAFFNQLSLKEASIITNHLKNEYIKFDNTVSKDALVKDTVRQILPKCTRDQTRALLQQLDEPWWGNDHLKKLANLDERAFSQNLVRFLNRIGPAQFSEATIEGLNFYVLSHQIEKTPWDFAALNNVTVQFPGLTHRLQRLDPSLIQQSLHLVHGLADAFFTQDNLSLTRQIDGKLYSMEQIPYLNRFIKNTPVLNQSHIDRLNNFVAKFPKQGIPETSSMLSLSLLVLNKPYPSAAPTFTSLFSEQKIETLDERNLDDAAIIALHRELDLLLKPVSTSGKSIIKGIQEYAVPRFLSVKFERESKLKKNLASYQQILATMQQQAGSLRESLEDKNSTLTSQQKQTIRASLHDFKQRFSTEIIKPIKSINLKHTQVKLGDEVLNDTLTKAYMAVYTPLTMGGDNAKAADEQDEAKYSFGSR